MRKNQRTMEHEVTSIDTALQTCAMLFSVQRAFAVNQPWVYSSYNVQVLSITHALLIGVVSASR
jgi:hypothetical protein